MGNDFKICPLCGYEPIQAISTDPIPTNFHVTCPRCGVYSATNEFMYFDPQRSSEIGYILSGLTRERNETTDVPNINTKNAKALATSYPAPDISSIEEKANKFLQRLRIRTKYYGETIRFRDIKMEYPLAYAKNSNEFISLLDLLKDKNLIKYDISKMPGGNEPLLEASLLAEGWNLTNNLGSANKDSEQGFVAIWFDDLMNESIAAIEEGIRAAQFTQICIKGELFPEGIMDKPLSEIRKSRFVVVDLTHNRPSVFFEAGFAHGLGLEAIYVYKELPDKDPLEFYVKHYQCYKYESSQDYKEIVKNAMDARTRKKHS